VKQQASALPGFDDGVVASVPMKDLSLKQGEKIVLKLRRSVEEDEAGAESKPTSAPSSGLSLAPPPPSGTRKVRGQRKAET
jgi:hypothetical protein